MPELVKFSPLKVAERFEGQLGLPTGFFQDLLQQDDWSFVIKLHALFEAALSQVIVHRLGCKELDGPISRLEMSDKQKGKIAFATSLEIIGSEDRRYLILLSQLRNKCVHDVRQAANFNLGSACAEMDKTQKNNFVEVLCGHGYDEKQTQDGCTIPTRELILNNPKAFLWEVGMRVLAILTMQKDSEEVRQQWQGARNELYLTLVENTDKDFLVDALIAAKLRQDG